MGGSLGRRFLGRKRRAVVSPECPDKGTGWRMGGSSKPASLVIWVRKSGRVEA